MIRRLLKRFAGSHAPQESWHRYRAYVAIHPTAIIDPCATLKIFNPPHPARPCIEIGEGSHIFGNFALLRPQATIRIGARCQIGQSHFVCADRIEVDDDVLMAWGITLMDNDSHALDWEYRSADAKRAYEDYRRDPSNLIRTKDWSHVAASPIRVRRRSWIGFNAAVLKGVTIGDNAVVAAHAVVSADVAPFDVVAGNPARVVRSLRGAVSA